jgi:hypothetical protein
VEYTKDEILLVLTDTPGDASVRFNFALEEMEVVEIDPYDEMGDVWVTLRPKGETEQETGEWYVGRHRKPDPS